MSIQLQGLVKRYGQQTIVDHVDLEIADGELFVLLGPSGSGKSTILRAIAGLTPVTDGRIILHGRDVTNLPPQQRDTGFVFQNYSLFRHMTISDNIEFGLAVRKVAKAARRQRSDELLDLVGLGGLGGRYPAQLSGGQQQRVAVARALASEPSVLLLDEPFGALDAQIRVQLRQSLKEIQRRLRVTTILVTHDQEEAFELADRMGIIDHGRLLGVGEPTSLYRRPQHEFVATFLGGANLLAGAQERDQVRFGPLTLPLNGAAEPRLDGAAEVLFRPEDLQVAVDQAALDGPALGHGVVTESLFLGTLQRVRVRLEPLPGTWPLPLRYGQEGIMLDVAMLSNAAHSAAVQVGQSVWVGIQNYHVLPRRPFRVLVGVDGVESSAPMRRLANVLGPQTGGALTVLAAAETEPGAELLAARLREQIEVAPHNGASGAGLITVGCPLPLALLRAARAGEYDLALVATAETGGDKVRRLALAAPIPVLVAKGAPRCLKRVLLCSAGGEPGKLDVLFGARLARRVNAAATLLYVAPPAGARAPGASWLNQHMEAGRITLLGQGVVAQTKVRVGVVVDEILAEAREGDYDLIVVGAHLAGRRRQPTGPDLAAQILTHADRPVLVVRDRSP